MTTPGRLEVDHDGKIRGDANISHNSPWPCDNGTPGGSGAMRGVVMHTMAGSYQGTVEWFNNAQAQASAFFAVSKLGQIWQFGPLGKSWMAWAQAAGNPDWYSIEHEDDGHPETPLTAEQIVASAQLLELLSRFAGFKLQVTDDVSAEGYVCHSDGGAPWGNHPDCPGPVRAAQRAEIVSLAREIRVGVKDVPAPPEPHPVAELEGILVQLPGGTARKVLSKDGGKSWQ